MGRGDFGGIRGAGPPSQVDAPIAFGGYESATVTWPVPPQGVDPITSFTITPYLGGEVPQTPIVIPVGPVGGPLDPTPGAHDQYTIPNLLIGFYSFTVIASSARGPSAESDQSNIVPVLAPPTALTNFVYISHLGLPIGLAADGTLNSVLQDSLDEVTQSVEMIVGSPLGARTVVPGFGVPDPVFSSPGPNSATILAAIQKWEPRAKVTVAVSNDGEGNADINVGVSLQRRTS